MEEVVTRIQFKKDKEGNIIIDYNNFRQLLECSFGDYVSNLDFDCKEDEETLVKCFGEYAYSLLYNLFPDELKEEMEEDIGGQA